MLCRLAGGQNAQHITHIFGGGEFIDSIWVIEGIGNGGNDLNMFIILGSDTNHEFSDIAAVFAKSDALWVLANHNAGFNHAIFGIHGTVWYGNGLTKVG